jgi:hypothetical protein
MSDTVTSTVLTGPIIAAALGFAPQPLISSFALTAAAVNGAGHLILTDTGNETHDLGNVLAEPGEAGPGYTAATITSAGHLVLTDTSAGTHDLGNVVGAPGASGPGYSAATITAGAIWC